MSESRGLFGKKASRVSEEGEESWRTKIEERVSLLEERKEEDSSPDTPHGDIADGLKLELEQFRRRIEALEGTKERQKELDNDSNSASPPLLPKAKDVGATYEARTESWRRGLDWLVFVALGLGLFAGYSFAKHVVI